MADLFALKVELEQKDLVTIEKEIFEELYTLLEFHQQAFQLYIQYADVTDCKQAARLFVLQDKVTSLKDTFARKDPRVPIITHDPTTVGITDFIESDKAHTYHLRNKEVVVFQKKVSCDRLWVYKEDKAELNDSDIKTTNELLVKITDYKEDVISFYTTAFEQKLGYMAGFIGIIH